MSPTREFDIHDIIRNYPYFLIEQSASMSLVHERVYADRTRSDFVFSNESKAVVVEIKRGVFDSEMLHQTTHYLDLEKDQDPRKLLKGLLVGKSPLRPEVKREISKSPYRIEERYLGVDVPSHQNQIKMCDVCRKMNWQHMERCEYCGSREFIKDPFIFLPTQ